MAPPVTATGLELVSVTVIPDVAAPATTTGLNDLNASNGAITSKPAVAGLALPAFTVVTMPVELI